MMAGRGDLLPVSKLPVDGTYPTATSKWEKRSVAQHIPEWLDELCIQCGNCSFVCPHAAIRAKFCHEERLEGAPASLPGRLHRLQSLRGRLPGAGNERERR